MKQQSIDCKKKLKEEQPPVKPESSRDQHPEDLHHVMSLIIQVDGPFHHPIFI